MEEKNHIYPIFDRMMTREDKEELLGQHSVMIWFTGLSGSGKSTIAIALEREMAANIIGKDDFLEVFVSTPLEECEKRDVKGLYAKARKGEIQNFTGISAPFEVPEHPALALDTSKLSLEESVNRLLEMVLPKIEKK